MGTLSTIVIIIMILLFIKLSISSDSKYDNQRRFVSNIFKSCCGCCISIIVLLVVVVYTATWLITFLVGRYG